MARPKVYPRHYGEDGIEYLLLIDANALRDLDTSWIIDEFAVQNAVRMFNEYSRTGALWFYIETGIELYVEQTTDGFIWAVDDTKRNSQQYQWLSNKAKRTFEKIIKRINIDGKELTDRLRMAKHKGSINGEHETGGE